MISAVIKEPWSHDPCPLRLNCGIVGQRQTTDTETGIYLQSSRGIFVFTVSYDFVTTSAKEVKES